MIVPEDNEHENLNCLAGRFPEIKPGISLAKQETAGSSK